MEFWKQQKEELKLTANQNRQPKAPKGVSLTSVGLSFPTVRAAWTNHSKEVDV